MGSYRSYLKASDITEPLSSMAWVFDDEQPDSINNACLFTAVGGNSATWG